MSKQLSLCTCVLGGCCKLYLTRCHFGQLSIPPFVSNTPWRRKEVTLVAWLLGSLLLGPQIRGQRTDLPRTSSQFQMPPCRSRHRSGRPLERGSRCFHHQPRTSENTRHTGTIAPRRYRLPHLQMDSFPHTRGTFSICSQPPLRRPSPPSQSRWRAPTPQRPPRTTSPRPNRPQPPPFDLLMDFAFGLCTSGDWPV